MKDVAIMFGSITVIMGLLYLKVANSTSYIFREINLANELKMGTILSLVMFILVTIWAVLARDNNASQDVPQ